MSRDKHPVTAAVRVLRAHGVEFTHHPYEYEERGGTEVSARELGVDEHAYCNRDSSPSRSIRTPEFRHQTVRR